MSMKAYASWEVQGEYTDKLVFESNYITLNELFSDFSLKIFKFLPARQK